MTMGQPAAVCLLVVRGDELLGVSRKPSEHGPQALSEFGLPGGAVESGETPLQAAIRLQAVIREAGVELDGLLIESEDLWPIYQGTDSGHEVLTYLAIGPTLQRLRALAPHRNAEGCQVDWVSRSTLLQGPFGAYNRKLLMEVDHV
jgi:8-oxo-dGTP pyrophosphatase MutT (NUDIX family)